jgi:hypothetical protein
LRNTSAASHAQSTIPRGLPTNKPKVMPNVWLRKRTQLEPFERTHPPKAVLQRNPGAVDPQRLV